MPQRRGGDLEGSVMWNVVLAGLLLLSLLAGKSSGSAGPAAANCARTSVGFTPLPDLGSQTYRGVERGLYPRGANVPPEAYLGEGVARAWQIVPRNSAGLPDAAGRVVLLSIGTSNAPM